jgi:hypothetical protein
VSSRVGPIIWIPKKGKIEKQVFLEISLLNMDACGFDVVFETKSYSNNPFKEIPNKLFNSNLSFK